LVVREINGVPVVRLENVLPRETNYVQASSELLNWTTISIATMRLRFSIRAQPERHNGFIARSNCREHSRCGLAKVAKEAKATHSDA
jgi:hypothetical protein